MNEHSPTNQTWIKTCKANETIAGLIKRHAIADAALIQHQVTLDKYLSFAEHDKIVDHSNCFFYTLHYDPHRGYFYNTLEKCEYQKATRQQIGFTYADFTYDPADFTELQLNKNTKAVHRLFQNTHPEQGFYLYGQNISAKTFLLRMWAHLYVQKQKQVVFLETNHLKQKINQALNTKTSFQELLTLCRDCDYLFLDNLGHETASAWFRDHILLDILYYRYHQQKLVFVSSKFSLKQIQKYYQCASHNHNSYDRKEQWKDIDVSKAQSLITYLKNKIIVNLDSKKK